MGSVRWKLTGAATAVMVFLAPPATAGGPARQTYHLPTQPLTAALRAVADRSGLSVAAPAELLEGKRAAALDGTFTAADAIDTLLAGTGLKARAIEGGIVIERVDEAAASPSEVGQGEVIVTGSRIRGGPQASTVITVSRDTMENQGKSDLGSVVRSLPQSFGGGQNPGVGVNVPAGQGVDVGGGSSINLRGLGSDATLTLLDGRRLAFTASRQSIDVSAIPFGAVERIEIVPDGASAIYGSDAVAGVANVILKRRAEGLEVGARLGGTSDGGYFQQQAWASGGLIWQNGSAVLSYDFGSNSPIVGAQRSYAASKPGLTLFPALRHHSFALAGQQGIGGKLTLEFDGLFNTRKSGNTLPTLPSGDIALGRAVNANRDRSWVIAPTLRLALGGDWRLALAGDVGSERVKSIQTTCAGTSCTETGNGYYNNAERSLEFSGDGPVLTLPAGDAKFAAGIGYRKIGFERSVVDGASVNAKHSQASYYVFSEAVVPLVGPGQGVAAINRLTATAAVRYERYPGIGGVPTPKLGLIWTPTPGITVKGSWGHSFKAPTQYQQYLPRVGVLYPPSLVGGGTGFPATAGVLYFQGGNPDLKPERATTWSATLALQPQALPGASFEISYFDVAYRNRIVTPVAFVSQALSNLQFAAQITRNPTAAQQAAIVSSLISFFNITGISYDPANVVAIIDNANVNAGRQRANGVDVLARYRLELGDDRSLGLTANASYLKSDQQISNLQPIVPLAGRIFSPPHWRGQGTLTYSTPLLTLASTLNVTGGVSDIRRAVIDDVGGMTTLDLTARYRLDRVLSLQRLEFAASINNVFNVKPDMIVSPAPTDTPYDSTNYSPLGRVISVALRGSF